MEEKNYDQKFIKEVLKMEPINIIGIARILGAKLTNSDNTGMAAVPDLLNDIADRYAVLSNTKKKEILKLCKATNKSKRSEKNGNRTESTDSTEENLPAENMQ